MKSRGYTPFAVLLSVSMLLAWIPGSAGPSMLNEPDQPDRAKIGKPITDKDLPLRPEVSKSAPQSSGGPDDFGHTWIDTAPYSWIDATIGTNTGIIGMDGAGTVNIGFPFRFYGQLFTEAHVSTFGVLGFDASPSGANVGCYIFPIPYPLRRTLHNFIAPYCAYLAVGAGHNPGAIYTLNGGTAPNRYFVVEWENVTDGGGQYALYFANSGAYSLTASRNGFGVLPPLANLNFYTNTTVSDLVLPPLHEAAANGGFETGDLTGWVADPTITTTVELTAAHTGNFGLRLSTVTTNKTTSPLDAMPAVTQTVTLSGSQPILSFMYRVTHGGGDAFVASIASDSAVITRSINLTPGDWNHAWLDLSSFSGQTITVTFGFQNPATAQEIHLDEISIGGTQRGVYPIYLPVVRR